MAIIFVVTSNAIAFTVLFLFLTFKKMDAEAKGLSGETE